MCGMWRTTLFQWESSATTEGHSRKKPYSKVMDGASFMKSHGIRSSGKPFTGGPDGKEFLATVGLFQHQVTPKVVLSIHSSTECEEAFHKRKSAYKCECGKAFCRKHIHLFSTKESTLEKDCTSAVNVGNPSATSTHLFNTRQFTLEKDLLSAVNVGRPSGSNINVFSTRIFTLEKGLMNVANMGQLLGANPDLFSTREFTLQ